MSVWFCIPSARPPEEAERVLKLWRAKGYKIALWRDEADEAQADLVHVGAYSGYAQAVNFLALYVLRVDSSCDWIVTGGDDTEPDMNHAAEFIAQQCSEHFDGDTFGVMQPTGDRYNYSKHQRSAPIDRVAGSPWLGREWCLRINQGRGPLWPEYTHMFVDEELQNVAISYRVFWQRPDLIQLHHHFQRESTAINSQGVDKPMPKHLVEWNTPAHWQKYQTLFQERKRANFPGSEPL